MNPLSKLGPPLPTPLDELCACSSRTALKLMTSLGFNPIHCVGCNLEVPPERLDLSSELVEALASWNAVAGAIERLWLDSGAYEEWARREMIDINSAVNAAGRELQRRLEAKWHCYYDHFTDPDTHSATRPPRCPVCRHAMAPIGPDWLRQRACDACSIIEFEYGP